MKLLLAQGKFDFPTKCKAKGCRGTKFGVVHDACVTEDWQQIDVQELDVDSSPQSLNPDSAREGDLSNLDGMASYDRGGGASGSNRERSSLRVLKVELRRDLVDKCLLGDLVQVVGVLQAIELDSAQGRGGKGNKLVFSSFVDANSIVATRSDERELRALSNAAHALLPSFQATNQNSPSHGTETTADTTTATAEMPTGTRKETPSLPPPSKFFTAHDLAGIKRIKGHPKTLPLLVASAVPSIFGLETVKLGLLLGLMGGTQSGGNEEPKDGELLPSCSPLTIRSNIHVLLVGDPGMGKSQMLRAVSSLAPLHVFVTGGFESSSVGLTASMASDRSGGGGAVLNAGALALADQGVCAIDELDKMSGEHTSLLEAMEQGRVTVAKAGGVSWLPARSSVLAASNPAGGRFNPGRSLVENLKMPPALLSRFDLIFTLQDRHSRGQDESVGAHLLGLDGPTSKRRRESDAAVAAVGGGGSRGGDAATALKNSESEIFAELLGGGGGLPMMIAEERGGGGFLPQPTPSAHHQSPGGVVISPNPTPTTTFVSTLVSSVASIPSSQLVPLPVLRRYVAFARRYCHPALTPTAARILQEHYLAIRRSLIHSVEDVPTTPRRLESLIRLAQARARLELCDFVMDVHAKEVCELLKSAAWGGVGGRGGGKEGGAHMSRPASAGPLTDGKRIKNFVAQLQVEARQAAARGDGKGGLWGKADLLALAANMCGPASTPRDFLDKVHGQGYLIVCNGGTQYKLAAL